MNHQRTTYFIYTTFRPNHAADNRALAYLRSLSELKYPVTVFFLLPDEHFSRLPEDIPGVSVVYCWDKCYIKKKSLNVISYIKYIISIYRKIKPGDIVYLYGGIDLLMLLSRKKGVHIFHERTEHPQTHPAKGLLFKPSIEKYLNACKRIDGLFVISTTLRDYFIESGCQSNRLTIVNSIVDFSRFKGLTKEETESYFAYCGNGNNKKDKVDELIKVFARVAARHEDIKFYIIGPTKQVYKDEKDNVQLVHELGLDDRVVFTGMKPACEVPQLLVNAKALFLTRPDTLQNRAGFSTKLGEYLASGNPVVAAGVGDIPLYLKDRENAFVFEPGDFNAVEDAMESILANPEHSKHIGNAGRITAERCFNSIIETKKLIAAFSRVQ